MVLRVWWPSALGRGPSDSPDGLPHGEPLQHKIAPGRLAGRQPIALDLAADLRDHAISQAWKAGAFHAAMTMLSRSQSRLRR